MAHTTIVVKFSSVGFCCKNIGSKKLVHLLNWPACLAGPHALPEAYCTWVDSYLTRKYEMRMKRHGTTSNHIIFCPLITREKDYDINTCGLYYKSFMIINDDCKARNYDCKACFSSYYNLRS
jgi:hypothetical protein